MKKNILLSLMLLSCSIAFSQDYLGYNTSKYAGVNGVFFNPASIAATPYRWDVNLFAINAAASTDYATLKTKDFFKVFKSGSKIDSLIDRRSVSNANLTVNVDVFGPSVLFNLNKKSSIAITTRGRFMVNVDKIPDTLLNTLENNGNNVSFPSTIVSDRFAITTHGWTELGVTYARVIADNNDNFFKAGLTVKYLGGILSGYFVSTNFNSGINKDILGNTYLQSGTGQIAFGSSGLTDNKIKIDFSGNGIGADAGFVYEYRPGEHKDKSDSYKFKAEVSLHDLGSIAYNHDADDGSYALNTSKNPNPPIIGSDTLQLTRFSNVSNFSDLSKALNAASPMIQKTASPVGKYHMALPTSLTAAFDYHFCSGFYVNLGGMVSLNEGGSKQEKTHTLNYLSLTPRYERKFFGIYLPLSINEISGFNAGLSLRGGPLFLGSSSILSTLIGGKTREANVYFGLHVGMFKKHKEHAAAPVAEKIIDTDGDGVPDNVDKCPTVPGVAKYNGCPIPDTDSDGINDEVDKCPTVPGVAKYNGCPIPDTDGDGINDEVDKCPTVPGVAKYNGCPIPDTDGDGINDEEDKCPTVPGVARYQGCPIPDTDSDGVNDEEDRCPTVPGPASNHGCPTIKKEIIQKVNFAAKSLLFQTGKAIILKKSYVQLNYVVKILKADSTINIDISGYTDNSGDSLKNMKLSTDRANAAKVYFVKKGISEKRITSEGYGQTKPIASNKTPQGRAKNRRVEFTLKNY